MGIKSTAVADKLTLCPADVNAVSGHSPRPGGKRCQDRPERFSGWWRKVELGVPAGGTSLLGTCWYSLALEGVAPLVGSSRGRWDPPPGTMLAGSQLHCLSSLRSPPSSAVTGEQQWVAAALAYAGLGWARHGSCILGFLVCRCRMVR